MALVMLPCDLPWWSSIHKKLSLLRQSTEIECMLEIMQKIHDLCNISLDPDEDQRDSTILDGLKDFLCNEMEESEREHFKTYTLMNLAKRAQDLKIYRPSRGLNFSLQQQPDTMEFNYNLLGALLANAFFSTFPKRTEKTHPTLQDYNFTNFFKSLDTNSQKAKFRSFLYYFDWLESITNNNNENFNDNNVNNNNVATNNNNNNNNNNADDNNNIDNNNGDNNNNKNSKNECIKISRKVMSGKQWLTIEDWLECNVPLCSLEIRHESKIERSRQDIVQTVFTSSRIGGNVLWGGNSQECMHFGIFPEMLATLLYVEALEDNEALFIENATQLTRIIDPGNRSVLEPLDEPRKISLCLMDAENYSEYPITQFEEDNILRELNKCLLAFRQNTTCKNLIEPRDRKVRECNGHNSKRLSPIGESGTNSPADGINAQLTATTTIIIKQASTVTKNASYDSDNVENDISRKRCWLSIDPGGVAVNVGGNDRCNNNNGSVPGPTASGRRGRFIVLGSSGECLPVNRISSNASACESIDAYSSCDSGSDDYLSANESVADSEDDSDIDFAHKYSKELDTPAKRYSFAEKLREALKQSDNYTESTDDSYAVDISISGSKTGDDEGIRIPRGGSTGFVLTEDSLDEDFYNNSLSQEKEWLEKFRNKLQSVSKKRGSSSGDDSNNSSKYSFSSEYSSDLEELYEQFSKWLENPILKDKVKELDPRDEAVLRFASSLLKRTLSESFVGVPLTDGCISSTSSGAEENSMNNYRQRKNRPILSSRSLSLELAKHKHRLAAHLKKSQSNNRKSSSKHSKWSITRVQTQQTIDCDDVILKISQIGKKRIGKGGVLPVATGNWGCGDNLKGDVQLKLAIQWMAASVAGLPLLVYYTSGHERLTKLDTVCRLLLDRQWTVSELAAATLQHAKEILCDPISLLQPSQCFFDKLIGI